MNGPGLADFAVCCFYWVTCVLLDFLVSCTGDTFAGLATGRFALFCAGGTAIRLSSSRLTLQAPSNPRLKTDVENARLKGSLSSPRLSRITLDCGERLCQRRIRNGSSPPL